MQQTLFKGNLLDIQYLHLQPQKCFLEQEFRSHIVLKLTETKRNVFKKAIIP